MPFFKTWKKFGKPGKNFEKMSGNPEIILGYFLDLEKDLVNPVSISVVKN